MKRFLCHLAGAVMTLAGSVVAASDTPGDTYSLSLEQVGPRERMTMADYQFQYVQPQTFHMPYSDQKGPGQPQVRIMGSEEQNAVFKRIVKKQPDFACPHPFRGVAKLGTQEFAFALDVAGAKAKPETPPENAAAKGNKAQPKVNLLETLARALTGAAPAAPRTAGPLMAYNRLFFDANRNGDLTDDQVIEAQQTGQPVPSPDFAFGQFPAVTVPLEADGVKFDYAFTMRFNSQGMGPDQNYAWVQLTAAAYRKGEITVAGKKHRVALIDFNSNGRYDDEMKIADNIQLAGGGIYANQGDVLLLDPETAPTRFGNPYDISGSSNRFALSRLLPLEGKFYEVRITPAGDQLRLTPSPAALGTVTNPNESFTAVVYGEQGFVKIRGGKSQPASLPVGEWRLYGYSVDYTNPAAHAAGQATKAYPAVRVTAGATAELPFGPPYKPQVQVAYVQSGVAQLSLNIIGSAGESCSDLTVNGQRPPAPAFKILDPQGAVVYQGVFKYG